MNSPVEQYDYPPDWTIGPISHVATFSRGVSWRKSEEAPDGNGLLVVSIPNIKDGWIDYHSKFNHYLSKAVSNSKCLNVGDIVFVGSSGSVQNVGRNARVKSLPNGSVAFASFTFKAAPIRSEIDDDFLYFLVNSDIVPFEKFCKRASDGKFNFQLRDFATRLQIPIPPLDEQRKIAHVLCTVHQAIEAQERIIQTTTELKKALMHKLFTEGLQNEPQKQTEIGPVPESWEVVPLGDLLEMAQYGMSVKGNANGNYPILRMTNQVNGRIVPRDLQYAEISDIELKRFRLERGDILFNRTNSFELVGRTAIFDLPGDFVFASYLIRLRTTMSRLSPEFLNCYFNTEQAQARLKSIATRAVSQSNISATRLKSFLVPVPRVEAQSKIVLLSDVLDKKISSADSKRVQLKTLFVGLLQQLMSARIRVSNTVRSGGTEE